jgi:hypothetical protein
MKTLIRWFLLLFLAGRVAAAPSLLLSPQPGWNGWAVTATVKSGFREHGGAGEVASTNTGTLNITPFGISPGMVFTLPAVGVSRLPESGAAKDKAEGAVSFTCRTGAAAETDSFAVEFNATTSAMSAKQRFGGGPPAPADAFFECEVVLKTFAPLTGGLLRLPDIPVLTAPAPTTESLLATVFGPTAGFFLPGYAGVDYPLTLTPGGTPFTYTLTYSIITPYGADPVVRYRNGGLAGAAPAAPLPPPTTAEESVRREMPVVKLDPADLRRLHCGDGHGDREERRRLRLP